MQEFVQPPSRPAYTPSHVPYHGRRPDDQVNQQPYPAPRSMQDFVQPPPWSRYTPPQRQQVEEYQPDDHANQHPSLVPHSIQDFSQPASELSNILKLLVQSQRDSTLPPPHVETFDGSKAIEYPAFIKNYEMLVQNTTNKQNKLNLLLTCTKGEAHDLIKDCILLPTSAEAYDKAINLLKTEYGHPAILAAAYKATTENWPQVASGDKNSIRKFTIFLNNCVNAKHSNFDMTHMDGYQFLRILAGKLPVALQQQWIQQVGKYRDVDHRSPSLEDFEKFTAQISRNANDPRIAGLGYQPKGHTAGKEHTRDSRGFQRRTAYATAVCHTESKNATSTNQKTEKLLCTFCEKTSHNVETCYKLANKPIAERLAHLKEIWVCFGCLNKASHRRRDCKKILKCKKCSGRHPTVLHVERNNNMQGTAQVQQQTTPNTVQHQSNSNEAQSTTSCRLTGAGDSPSSPCIIPVIVRSKSTGLAVETLAYMDNGSDAVFCAEHLRQALGMKGKRTKLQLQTMTGEETVDTAVLQGLEVHGLNDEQSVKLPNVYTQRSIPADEADIITEDDISKWPYLNKVHISKANKKTQVGILIGNNVPEVFEPWE